MYLSNRPGADPPGHVGQPVPGLPRDSSTRTASRWPTARPASSTLETRAAALCYHGDPERSARTFAGDDDPHRRPVRARRRTATTRTGAGADDLLKVGGIWVAPIEIEACLLEHAAVQECAVVGVERDGPRDHAGVRRRPGRRRTRSPDELRTFVRTRLAPYKAPRDDPRSSMRCRRRRTARSTAEALLESESEAA